MILENPRTLPDGPRSISSNSVAAMPPPRPVMIVVEGAHDVGFLSRLTNQLHQEDSTIPQLAMWEQIGHIIFVPFGGGRVLAWASRFAALGCAEFHLYDREIEPETAIRNEVVSMINRRSQCRALLLTKHSLENYLHTAAIFDAGGGRIPVGDDQRMSTAIARHWYLGRSHDCEWDELSLRAKRRLANLAKRWLNTDAVDRMTLSMLHQRDPGGELISWLRAITAAVNDR
jgi:hypothetical protein